MTRPDWPLVDPKDDGIRPAGPPDECLYCQRKVGQLHGDGCVVVRKLVEYAVTIKVDEATMYRAIWLEEEPHEWDAHMCEFHKNESSWCAGNFTRAERVTWEPGSEPAVAWLAEREGQCLCGSLEFRLVRVVDDTPRRDVRP